MLVRECMEHGVNINFGGPNEIKIAREISGTVVIEGEGVKQILDRKLPPEVQFKGKAVDAYVEEYTYEFAQAQNDLPSDSNQKHPYTYMGRFIFPTDQIESLKAGIKFQQENKIMSNRVQMTTWHAETDSYASASPPCLQRIWIRWNADDNSLDIHLNWRSRDLFDAWTSNLIGIVWMINEYIAEPLGCRIGRLVDNFDSLHIYDYNWDVAKKIK
ncbi:MAG: thymidylate synthase [Candidatus Pacebacteria bacterium]|nr:thymidylate synthase [Candidatus Paceibacterota bacterium]